MSLALPLATGLLLAAQSLQLSPTDGKVRQAAEPVAVSVGATVRVLRPAVIDHSREAGHEPDGPEESGPSRQRRVDAAGTVWIEFS